MSQLEKGKAEAIAALHLRAQQVKRRDKEERAYYGLPVPKRQPRVYLTAKEAAAALTAINAMLAGEQGAGDWPDEIDANDLIGAADKIVLATNES